MLLASYTLLKNKIFTSDNTLGEIDIYLGHIKYTHGGYICTRKYTHSAAVATLELETAKVKQSIKGYGGLEGGFAFLLCQKVGIII